MEESATPPIVRPNFTIVVCITALRVSSQKPVLAVKNINVKIVVKNLFFNFFLCSFLSFFRTRFSCF